MVSVTTSDTVAAVGGEVTLNLLAENGDVSSCSAVIRLGRQFTDYEVIYADGFTGTSSYQANENTVTLTAEGNTTGTLIAQLKVKVPATLASSESFLYEVKSGVCYDQNRQMSTFAAPVKTLPVVRQFP